MKKPIFLILIGIGVLLLVGGIVFVVPWFVNVFQEMEQMGAQQAEYKRALRQYANEPLTEEQQKLLSQLLEVTGEILDPQSPEGLEVILSTEPYLAYIKTQDGQDYVDFPSYIAAMPTPNHRTVVLSRLKDFLGTEIEAAEQEIWINFYYIIRDWSKTGKDVLANRKEFNELLQQHLIKPLMNEVSGTEGLTSQILKMGMVSASMTEDNEVFHSAWHARLKSHGTQEGYLRCAIATPAEFALMRSFFEDAAAFETWITEPFEVEEETEGQENE